MKSRLFFLLVASTQIIYAQSFTEAFPAPEFDDLAFSSIAFSDVNGDGNDDVFITGINNSDERISKLYKNDGMGNFIEILGTPFEGVSSSSVAFSDVNGDGSNDILITGISSSEERISQLYTNDGMGNFTEMPDTPFEGVSASFVAFSDVNGNGSDDVLITGINNLEERISKLYTNDGMGNFTEMLGTPFDSVYLGSIAFSDVNEDGSSDVLITGKNNSEERISKLYTNDGMGNFTEMSDTLFDGVSGSSVAFSDVNGDGNEDVLITGWNGFTGISKLYTNDGMGNFTEMSDTPFEGVFVSSIAFSDVNGDGSDDVLITGWDGSAGISKLYTNDGMGNFIEVMDTPFEGISSSSVAFSDINGDGDQDVLITGIASSSGEGISKLYNNDDVMSSTNSLAGDLKLGLTLYPNPTKATTLNINFDAVENGLISVNVFDLNGRLLSQQKEFTVIGQQTISIDITSLFPGTYFIQTDHGKRKGVAKFMIQ